MGLIRGMARTAVVAGTATAVSNRVSRRQADRWAAQDAQQQQAYAPEPAYAPAPAAPTADEKYAQLEKLADLKAKGILTDEEFAVQKAQILAS